MAYTTTSALQARLGTSVYARLTDRVAGTTADSTVAQQILNEADAEVNAHLARRYQTPVDLAARPELAEVLEARTLDLAEYFAWRGSPFVSDLPQRVKAMHAQALQWLQAVSEGRVDLPAIETDEAAAANSTQVRFDAGGGRTFTAEQLDGL